MLRKKINQKIIDECSPKILISHTHKFIFIHTPKSGGTTIKKILAQKVDDFHLSEELEKMRLIDEFDVKKYGLKSEKGHAFHLPLSEQKKMVPKEIWDSYFKFTFVRNPWDYLVSYYFFKKEEAEKKKLKNPDEFQKFYNNSFKEICVLLKGDLSEYYLEGKNRIGVNYIGRLETINYDIKYILEKIGIKYDEEIPHFNISKHKHYSEYYDDELIKFVSEKYKKTIDLFDYNFLNKDEAPEIQNPQLNHNDIDRVKYYLGKFPANLKDMEILNPEKKVSYYDLKRMTIRNFKDPYVFYKRNIYIKHMKKLLTKAKKRSRFFLWKPGDINKIGNDFLLSKIRTNDSEKVTILNFTPKRHWNYVYNKPKDIDFDKKIDAVIWRGADTGSMGNLSKRSVLIKKYFNKNLNINVGYSKITKNTEDKKYLKEKLSPEEMLKYKYILSVEGNDDDSGINWKLNSNSLVLMPKPTKYSWLMEEKLIPGKHYILLKDDFSDLEEKLEWCRNHQEECKEIIKNANQYMSQFMDKEKEREIEREVLNQYFLRMKPLGVDVRGVNLKKIINT